MFSIYFTVHMHIIFTEVGDSRSKNKYFDWVLVTGNAMRLCSELIML